MDDLSDQKVPSMTDKSPPSYEPTSVQKAREYFVQTLPHRIQSTSQVFFYCAHLDLFPRSDLFDHTFHLRKLGNWISLG